MELTLNLFWLLLIIPAIWLWQGARCARPRERHLQGLLVLGCVLMVLFPVVSATDDLQAMRPEMEEAGTQDATRRADHGRLPAGAGDSCNTFALVAARHITLPEPAVWGPVADVATLSPAMGVVTRRAGRAPPLSFLG
jgi:hypothetical protein